ncbi:MAG TPA: hypothetical protein VM509_03945 [Planctomycetota bacterium]|nr:hypothetical protein [Planctomycetota bacterium]
MHLIQTFLPTRAPDGTHYDARLWTNVRAELVEAFGGVTVFAQSPAEGLWKDPTGEVEADRLIVLEVQDPNFDRAWWSRFRTGLEARFKQEKVLMRAIVIESI